MGGISLSDHLDLWRPCGIFLVILSNAALHDWPEVADQTLHTQKEKKRINAPDSSHLAFVLKLKAQFY